MIHVDFETYSEADLPAVGAHRYAADPSTEPLCVGVADTGGAPVVYDLSHDPYGRQLASVFARVAAGEPITAHNAEFERSIWAMLHARYGWPKVKRSQFHCTAARAAAAGLPRKLNIVAGYLGLPVQKDPHGVALIKQFCIPQKKGGRIRPDDDPNAFRALMTYCQQDVVVEQALDTRIPQLGRFERDAFLMDALLNDRGFPVDLPLIDKAIVAVESLMRDAIAQVERHTGLRPTQRDKLLAWLREKGVEIGTLQAQEVQDLIDSGELPDDIQTVLQLRLETSRAGLSKLNSMKACACPDGRVRGTFMYYGAHTGRWSASKVQPHNFARGNPEEQDRVLEILDRGGADMLRVLYSNPLIALSQSIRGFIATPLGRRWVFADYAAIEARVLAWIANATEILERYRRGVDLYKWMASRLYDVPESEVTKEQRRIGKNLILGCGYGLSGPSFVLYCARAGVTITEEFAVAAVKAYRQLVPEIVSFWYRLEDLVQETIITGVKNEIGRCVITREGAALHIRLPSGRLIQYNNIEFKQNAKRRKDGTLADSIVFDSFIGANVYPEHTYGSKITENIVQGISRDLMLEGMWNAEREGYPISITVHDELGSDLPDGIGCVRDFEQIITRLPDWAAGLPIGAEGFEARRYRKN